VNHAETTGTSDFFNSLLGTGLDFATQMVVSTHSSHIAHECEFDSLRYFRRLPGGGNVIPTSCVVNLEKVFGDDLETKRFVTRYLRVTHCDLFFADAAVLIEGPAERILVPNFVNCHPEFDKISESYVTWLEIGGSHAHKLRSLIQTIGLTTLVITDIDSCDRNGASASPVRGAGHTTRNTTLRTWWPVISDLESLLDIPENKKCKIYEDERFSVRVAYQAPIQALFRGETAEALSYTLEDAIVMENIDLFEHLPGNGLIAKFRAAIANSADLDALKDALKGSLSSGGKAEFALDLLEINDPTLLKPPAYIKNGLLWLAQQLEQKQVDLGLAPIAEGGDVAPSSDAA